MSDVEHAYENWLTQVKPFPLCDTDPCAFRAGYAAAEADLREAIAREIEAADLYPDSLPRLTYDDAARIVRGRNQ